MSCFAQDNWGAKWRQRNKTYFCSYSHLVVCAAILQSWGCRFEPRVSGRAPGIKQVPKPCDFNCCGNPWKRLQPKEQKTEIFEKFSFQPNFNVKTQISVKISAPHTQIFNRLSYNFLLQKHFYSSLKRFSSYSFILLPNFRRFLFCFP